MAGLEADTMYAIYYDSIHFCKKILPPFVSAARGCEAAACCDRAAIAVAVKGLRIVMVQLYSLTTSRCLEGEKKKNWKI